MLPKRRLSVCMCVSVIHVHLAKAVGRNEMPFRVVPSNIVLDRPVPVPQGKGRFGVGPPVRSDAA